MSVDGMVRIDPRNSAQLEAWDGGEGTYWAAHPDEFDRSLAAHHGPLLDAAAIADGEQALDLGCGTGQTTRDAARGTPSGSALGVDLSSAMLDVARRRAEEEGVANARFLQADAQVHPFEAARFDVAISRTGGMFFADLVAAYTNVARALRPGGRLVLLAWQAFDRNEWIREISTALAAGRDRPGPPPGAPGPFSLAVPDQVRSILGAAGFTDVDLRSRAAPMWFGTDADHALEFVLGLTGWMLEGLDDTGRRRAVAALHDSLAAHETPGGVLYDSAAWTITATRG
jgi:SAM-dependent methyltransferase